MYSANDLSRQYSWLEENAKGFVSKEGDKYLSEMDGMALCLLGDIHLYQIMHKENPKALYSSSLISQNFGETDVNHGFVMHHLKYSDDGNDTTSISGLSLSHEYIRIENKIGFKMSMSVKGDRQSSPMNKSTIYLKRIIILMMMMVFERRGLLLRRAIYVVQ